MVDQMPSVPASAVPVELGGIKYIPNLKGLSVDYLLTRLCPNVRCRLLPCIKGKAIIHVGNVYLVIAANCVSWKLLAEAARRFSKANAGGARHHLIKQATSEFSIAEEHYGLKQCGKWLVSSRYAIRLKVTGYHKAEL